MQQITFEPSPAHRLALSTYDRLTIAGMSVPLRPISCNDHGWVLAETEGNGLSEVYPHMQLAGLDRAGHIRHERGYFDQNRARARSSRPSQALISALPPKQLAAFLKSSAYLAAYEKLRSEGLIKASQESYTANEALLFATASRLVDELYPTGGSGLSKSADFREVPSWSTLKRWQKRARLGGEAALPGRFHKRGNRNRKMDGEAIALMVKTIRRAWLDENRKEAKQVWEAVDRAFKIANEQRRIDGHLPLVPPSRETVRKEIALIDPFGATLARIGPGAARTKFRPVGAGIEVTRAGERVEIDEISLDLFTIPEMRMFIDGIPAALRRRLGLEKKSVRWTVTVAIDVRTRCILGIAISRTPNHRAARQVLQMTMVNKGRWACAADCHDPWDMACPPELIVSDGGSAFIAPEFKMACADLGIATEIAVGGLPELRAFIERIFGTLNLRLLPLLSGRTFGDVVEKGEADPQSLAALTFDDLAFCLTRWIVDAYHNTPHSGLGGKTPRQVWQELVARDGVAPSPDNQRWRMVFGERLIRALDKRGIVVLGVRYHCEALALWMSRKGEQKLHVRWHPRDLGGIEVYLGDQWITVPAVKNGFETWDALVGKSANIWLDAIRNLRAAHPDRKTLYFDMIDEAMQAIDARNEQARWLADLFVDEWTEERIEKARQRLFIGFRTSARPQSGMPATDGPGRSIPAPDDDEEEDRLPIPRAAERPALHKPNIPARTASAPPAEIPSDKNWSIEE
ncbi:Mu transposase C-terminal domain-containing protein [Paracoccus binzhouensis]|uniref:Mu transposase C-terminal domain-containing protein n=1 Tax=Paracoccus binzhouensis TaxID=2796149 RepID=UPI0018EF3244|nr:Mu transposase C-terminal domain-containing protein [Paracoccus binzhouensis]